MSTSSTQRWRFRIDRGGNLPASLERNSRCAPPFDTDRFRRHIESAYTTMWKIAERGEAPRGFAVEPAR
jgi:hypothetical protein